ncbi:FGGY-family carbohydrate kinase [Glaciimonas immobilis]|uniref:Xylulokinase n=1 Tax=Glaciimonas immobilis TaxID=728004 RepID=A0A840RXK7_9BURK|nr:FGGY-family carbohydrate kinase [Glaciimonas immobilis]KAF3996274.1 FGGY-family carbohydrate kinase [Glaciimonas immobilis]MBB5202313.1 xylulokinase [Glaciimonas immobilis]
MDYVIGVDIGTQSTKALLVDHAGSIVAQHASSYELDTPRPLWAEQWPSVWCDAVTECIQQIVRKSGLPAGRIKAICVSSLYGGAGIPVDRQMKPLHPCLIWMDRRANDEVRWINETVDLERLYTITGNSVDSYYGFTKMLWIKKNRPDIWKRTHLFLPPNAYINYLLCGEIAVDHSSAGNIGGIYDVRQRCWSEEMLDCLGIPAQMMPGRLVNSSDVVGRLLPEQAAHLGLAAGTAIVAGGVDAAVATFAAGVTSAGNHVAMIGTSMCWGYINQQVDAHHGLISMPHVYNSREDLYIFGGAIAAGASVSWFREGFCQAEIAAAAQLEGGDAHQILEEEIKNIAPGADGIIFLPYLMGERSPVWDAKASGAFIGLSLFHTRAHLYRAVLEGVSFALRHNIEAGAKGAQSLDAKLIVVGGAAHSDLWMQMIADVTGYQVYTIEENVEAALGAALLAAVGIGLVDDNAAKKGWVTLVPRTTPDSVARVRYDHAFSIYCDVYPALKPIMHRLQGGYSQNALVSQNAESV